MSPLVIESEAMRVGVLPAFGARVVSLFDKADRRDWIYQGGLSTATGEDATYGAAEACGWDECFPTVSSCDATDTLWGRRLRDHGDLWGRPWAVGAHDATALTTTYTGSEFAFTRRLAVTGATLTASYRVDNRTGTEMPFLWALHGLLAAPSGDRIVLPGVTELRATYLGRRGENSGVPDDQFDRLRRGKAPSPGLRFAKPDLSPQGEVSMGHGPASASPLPGGRGRPEGPGEGAFAQPTAFAGRPVVPWPNSQDALGFRLDEVQPETAGFAGKFYGEPARPCAAVGHDGQWLVIGWSPPLTTLGVWLNYHGWPSPPHGHHLALEPTTAPADHLAEALRIGRAARIAPGAAAEWTITLTLSRTAP